MREKYESLPLAVLRDLAKARGLKGTSAMKKSEVVEAMLKEDERQKAEEREKPAAGGQAQDNEPAKETDQKRGSASEQGKEDAPHNGGAQENLPVRKMQPAEQNVGAPRQNASQDQPRRSAKPDQSRQRVVRNTPVREDASRQNGTAMQQGSAPQMQQNTAAPQQGNVPQQGAAPMQQGSAQVQQSAASPQAQQPDAARPGRMAEVYDATQFPAELDSGVEAYGILEVMPDGYGFIRGENYLPGENDVYVAPSQIRRFGLKTGDILRGNKRVKTQQEKFSALLYVRSINGYTPEESAKRKDFGDMTPIFPDQRIRLETPGCGISMRVMDLISPVGRGQRGMIVSPPKAGKTTLLKEVAKSILRNNPKTYMLILLIDERPEEVTDIREAIIGENVEVIYSTFDELPEHHKRVSEMAIERAKRLVEHKEDVVILLDSITRLTRAYNQVVPPSGRTLSGGLDPSALHMPKRFFGAARNMREGGSLTILATALVDTGSKMDDVVYEEFKGTGNMEIVLDRKLSEKRIFPAIDLAKSSTRREDLLLDSEELEAINIMRKALNGLKPDEATDRILDMFARTRNNAEFVQMVKKNKFI
ncbi:MAG: transcription termination factor Rho [Lachnospiraceae bacterium]|nr:transcription termination factor Rho [Lachnospiraceae bacterium]